MQRLKHLKYYKNYIAEQELPAIPADEMTPGIPAAAAPKVEVYKFIFIEEGDTGTYKYPDGSSYKLYPTYEISRTDLEKWLKSNVVGDNVTKKSAEVKRDNILDFISGERGNLSPEDKNFVDKFKNNVLAEVIGKKAGDTEVTFSRKEKEPSTDSFDVTFIILPKGK